MQKTLGCYVIQCFII
jgi:ankyrin repeat protein